MSYSPEWTYAQSEMSIERECDEMEAHTDLVMRYGMMEVR